MDAWLQCAAGPFMRRNMEMGLIGQRERGHLGPSRWQPRKKRQFNARRPILSRSSIHSKPSAKPVVLNYPFHDKPPGITRNRFCGAVDVGFLGCVASQHTRPEMPCFRLAKCGLKLGLPFMWRGQYAAKGAALHLRLVGQFDPGRIVNWKTDGPKRILRACQNLLVIDPANAARFMIAASTWLSRARSAVLNAPCAVQLSRIGTLLGSLDIDSLPVQPGC
jgi:hypothetical protein